MHLLYGSRGSGSAAIEAALTVCELPFEEIRASTWEPESAQTALAAVNPLGQIPTLVLPDGSAMSESAAILIHLGLSHPGSGLLPSDPMARAQALRGLVYLSANCYAAIGICDYPERWTIATTKPAQEKVRQGARRRLHMLWDRFADSYPAPLLIRPGQDAQARALGLLAAVVSHWSGTRGHLAANQPDLLAQLKRLEDHDSVRAVFQRHWSE